MRIFFLSCLLSIACISLAHAQHVFDVKDRLNTPTVIFVPGVLGSRLVDDEGKVVWGDLTKADPKLFYDGTTQLSSEPLDSVSVFGVTLRQHTYGAYLDSQMSNLATAENFLPFSYDWRASTRKSSEEFAKFVCEEADLDRPLIIVAHSMGGILVKRWLMHNYDLGCQGDVINIHRLVFVATPNLGAPRAFSTLIFGMDLFGFSAVDAVISRGLNEHGLSFDSTYELLPFTNSYSMDSGNKERCFPATQFGPDIHRVLFKASNNSYYETLDIFSVNVLERLGVVSRVEDMLEQVNRSDLDAKAFLKEKLRNARLAICELSNFRPPEELAEKIIYFYGNLRTDDLVHSTTIGQIIISDARLDTAQTANVARALDDAQYPDRQFYVYTNDEPGDGTVPTLIAADPMKQGLREPRFANSSHIGVLSNSGFRELAGALLSQDYSQEAWMKLNEIGWDGVSFSSPTYAMAAQAIAGSGSQKWSFVSGLPHVDEVVVDGRIDLGALRNAYPGASLKIGGRSSEIEMNLFGTVWDASLWEYVFDQSADYEPDDLFLFASLSPSAENWHLAGSIAGLEESKIVEALTYAGGEYLARGELMTARTIYAEAKLLTSDPSVAAEVNPDALVKLKTGSRWAEMYAGTKQYSQGDNTILNMSIDFPEAVTFTADPELALRAYEELESFSTFQPTINIGERSLKDSLRDEL